LCPAPIKQKPNGEPPRANREPALLTESHAEAQTVAQSRTSSENHARHKSESDAPAGVKAGLAKAVTAKLLPLMQTHGQNWRARSGALPAPGINVHSAGICGGRRRVILMG
jgi:hypothetical protein